MPKIKVSPYDRRRWLESHQPPSVIAHWEGLDTRTVIHNIQIAQEEQATKEARTAILVNSQELHLMELCEWAQHLKTPVFEYGPDIEVEIVRETRLTSALRQHLPRAKIWKYINQRNAILRNLNILYSHEYTKYKSSKGKEGAELRHIEVALAKELDIITYKHFVPGHCCYCAI